MAIKKKLLRHLSLFSLSLTLTTNIYAESLPQVLSDTVFTNPEIMIRIKRVLADREGIAQARAGYYPKVDLTATFGRENAENTNNEFSSVTTWHRAVGLTGRQMLFDGYFTCNEVARNIHLSNADGYQLWGTSEDIALKAAEAYLNVLRTRELIVIARENLGIHERVFGLISERTESGVGRAADSDQATARLALARANFYTAQNAARDAEATYERLIGLLPHNLAPPPIPTAANLPPNVVVAINTALRDHPILKAANSDIQESRSQYASSASPFFPRVDFVVSLNKARDISGVFGPNNDYSGLLELNYNLLNGGKDLGRKRQTAYQIQEAMDTRNRTYRQVVENMRLAWNAYKTLTQKLPALRLHRNASFKTKAAYKEQFELGKRTLLDLLDSQNEWFASSNAYINGRYDYLDAQYRILNGEGKLLPFFKISLPGDALPQYSYTHGYLVATN